jgi:hypothetical protein
MDKSFRHWTLGAVIAAVVFTIAIWWAGNDNGISGICSTLAAQGTYCGGFRTNFWWLVLAIASAVYLGLYIARVRRILHTASPARDGAGSATAEEHDDVTADPA